MKRDQNLNIRVTAAEKASIEAAARAQRRTAADYARLAILSELEGGDIPVEGPYYWDSGPYHHVTDAIAHVIETMTEENYVPFCTFAKAVAGETIGEPCSAVCHLLLHLQAGIIKENVWHDAYQHLLSIADAMLVKKLSDKHWPIHWLPTEPGKQIDTFEIAGEIVFSPDLNQAKAVLSALADQTLPGQKNHSQ